MGKRDRLIFAGQYFIKTRQNMLVDLRRKIFECFGVDQIAARITKHSGLQVKLAQRTLLRIITTLLDKFVRKLGIAFNQRRQLEFVREQHVR